MNSVKGAINHIRWDEKTCKVQIETIYNGHPQGLCASGMIDFLYLLRSTGLLAAEGRILNTKEAKKHVHRLTLAKLKNTFGYDCLSDDDLGNGIFTIHKNPDIYMTTKDCQNLLKAIAAVKTGIEILLSEQKIDIADLNHFIIAGGLGEHIDSKHAVSIGMFPEHIDEKLLCAGNTSLKGAISALCDSEVFSVINNISQSVDYLELANHSDFADTYIKHLKYK
ncbi:MAG: ATP-binding protein [Lachnospiraceae bacterium]|nr:ATP-binding protein [Lachnospiraceae bacterium]